MSDRNQTTPKRIVSFDPWVTIGDYGTVISLGIPMMKYIMQYKFGGMLPNYIQYQ